MNAVGLKPFIDKINDPCIWAKKYSKPSSVQTAQKEKDNANYLLGSLNVEITNEFWEQL